MDRPLCPLCKTKHFAREPHVFKTDGGDVKKGKGEDDEEGGHPSHRIPAEVVEEGKGIGVDEKQGVFVDKKFDRTAYQRNYMQAVRAIKAGKASRWPRDA